MATLHIETGEKASIDISVRESDKYTQSVLMKLSRNSGVDKVGGVNEIFMTPTELDQLGRFLIRQADEINTAQAVRKKDLRS
jgi:hypothetical protein